MPNMPSLPQEPVAYLNGAFLPHRDAALPVWDLGIVQGATVTEALRTFRHEPFRVAEHLDRLEQSLAAVGIELEESRDQLEHVIRQVVGFNTGFLGALEDVSVILFATAGDSVAHLPQGQGPRGRATVCLHTARINFRAHVRWYVDGLRLATPTVRHIPGSIIDPRIKHRSRLHWRLGDREVQQADPQAEALLLDVHGFVTETAKGNLLALYGDEIRTPRSDTTLGGISRSVVRELAGELGLAYEETDLTPAELADADELWVSSTTSCLVPVSSYNGWAVGVQRPGPVWRKLMDAWSRQVGMDIVAQAETAAAEPAVC